MIKNGVKSFEQWCVDNNKQYILDLWDYELNNKKPNEVTYGSGNKYWFKCPLGTHESELQSIHDFTNNHMGSISCTKCNSFAQYLLDTYGENSLELYWNYEKNNKLNINPWNLAKNSNKKVWIICQEEKYHGSYNVICGSFVNGSKCPYCSNQKIHPLDSLGQILEDKDLLDLWSEKNKKSPYEYSPNNGQKVWWKCENQKHQDYHRGISSSSRCKFRCPSCVGERDESFLQEKVRLYLELLEYTVLHEYNCTIIPRNPKVKNKRGQMPFDNEVKELKLIIEIMGEQHYQISIWHKSLSNHNNTTPKYELHMQQVRDRYKRFVAYKQGYEYLEISYKTDNEKEDWKRIIDNKINEIMTIK